MTGVTAACEAALWKNLCRKPQNLWSCNDSATFWQHGYPKFFRNEVERPSLGSRSPQLETELGIAVLGFLDAAREVKDTGRFHFLDRSVVTADLNKLMQI